MLISVSLFARENEVEQYAQQLGLLGADFIHLDYLENESGSQLPIFEESMENQIPYDIHLIVRQIEKCDIDNFNSTNTSYLCYQYENLADNDQISMLRQFKGKIGLGFTMKTPIETIESCLPLIDFILIMCTEPGVSGAQFDERNMERIKYLRIKYPEAAIHVDGGMNLLRTKILKELDVDLCVCGSFLAVSEGSEFYRKYCELKFVNPDIKAYELMVTRNNDMFITNDKNFMDILYCMNLTKRGMVFVEADDGSYEGIITSGDIRRKILEKEQEIFNMKAVDIVNCNSYSVKRDTTLVEILMARITVQKFFTIIPVLENKRLIGIVDLNKIM